jgi:hypothetical protein
MSTLLGCRTPGTPSCIPESIECTGAFGSVQQPLIGSYWLSGLDGQKRVNLTTTPSGKTYIFEKDGAPADVILVYCEGVPELLPADIWETVIADALAGNAEANMVAAASAGELSDLVAEKICSDIRSIACEVSHELVGWIIVTYSNGALTPLARCTQRFDSPVSVGAGFPVFDSSVSWETRHRPSDRSGLPDWFSSHLSPSWLNLVTQSGCFTKTSSFSAKPATSSFLSPRTPPIFTPPATGRLPVVTIPSSGAIETIEEFKINWKLNENDLNMKLPETFCIESPKFSIDGIGEFMIQFTPIDLFNNSMINLNLIKIENSKNAEIKFKISIENSANSGLKKIDPVDDQFEVLIDPRKVFGPGDSMGTKIEKIKTFKIIVEFIQN